MKNLELIALIILSWLLIWLFEKGKLSILGLKPTANRLKILVLLFGVTALCCSIGFFMRMYFGKEVFALNPQLTTTLILTGVWRVFESVLFEELLFRGVGLYILIKKVGQKWAILISAIVFSFLHINIGGNVVQVITTVNFTFFMGLVLAYAYAKTGSLYASFAIHFGWNLMQNFIFSEGTLGHQLFISVLKPEVTVSYFVFFSLILLPKISAIVLNYLILKRQIIDFKNFIKVK